MVGMNREALLTLDKEALIDLMLTQAEAIKALTARVAELETKLGEPLKTPDNSSLPPWKGQKPSAPATPKANVNRRPIGGSVRPDTLCSMRVGGRGRQCRQPPYQQCPGSH
jgi:hypothetical protein